MGIIIKNKIVNIFGPPGSGKTFLSSYFAFFYFLNGGQIFSNVEYFYKNGEKRINKKIQKISDIQYIEYQEKKGLIVIDEGGLNINSRRSSSNSNLEFAELTFLGRKKNCDIIFIAQLDYSIDKYIRDLATLNIEMNSYFVSKDYLMYSMQIKKKDFVLGFKDIDLIEFAKLSKFTYSTLESSKIEKKATLTKEEINKFIDGKNNLNGLNFDFDLEIIRNLEKD